MRRSLIEAVRHKTNKPKVNKQRLTCAQHTATRNDTQQINSNISFYTKAIQIEKYAQE